MRERYIRDIIMVNRLMLKSLLIKDYIMMENYRIILEQKNNKKEYDN